MSKVNIILQSNVDHEGKSKILILNYLFNYLLSIFRSYQFQWKYETINFFYWVSLLVNVWLRLVCELFIYLQFFKWYIITSQLYYFVKKYISLLVLLGYTIIYGIYKLKYKIWWIMPSVKYLKYFPSHPSTAKILNSGSKITYYYEIILNLSSWFY